jgi:polyphenol oxidase
MRAMPSPIASPALSAIPSIRHAFFTREGGVSEGPVYASLNGGMGSNDERAHVVENRRRMAAHLGVPPERLLSVWQVHSPDCLHVTAPWPGERPKADAMATATPGLALGIATADCGPLLFADPKAHVIGVAHAGWKGAIGGVIEATLARMEELGARRADITVAIGPMLSQANYEVGPEFVAQFVAADNDNARFFAPSPRPGHAMFDLPAYNRVRLERAGVGAVEDLALCTYADERRFYSYRRTTHRKEPDYGRLISAIALSG